MPPSNLTSMLARAGPRSALAVAGTGVTLIAAAAVLAASGRPLPADFGSTSPARQIDVSPLVPTGPLLPGPRPTARPAAADPPTVALAAPLELGLPTLGVTAVVQPVAVNDGVLAVPADPARVGWWSAGPLPGAAEGTVTIDGHVDTAGAGPGSLSQLTRLRVGDPVTLATAAGRSVTYLVTARRVYAKSGGLPVDTFATTGAPRLALVTCGGPFDEGSHHYQDNIVVFAAPVGTT